MSHMKLSQRPNERGYSPYEIRHTNEFKFEYMWNIIMKGYYMRKSRHYIIHKNQITMIVESYSFKIFYNYSLKLIKYLVKRKRKRNLKYAAKM